MREDQKIQIARMRASGLGCRSIANKLGLSINTVKSFCRRKNINVHTAANYFTVYSGERTKCENCGREIRQKVKQKKQRFCCDKCRNQWWNSHLDTVKRKAYYHIKCQNCGKDFEVYGDCRRKFCSYECYFQHRFGKQV